MTMPDIEHHYVTSIPTVLRDRTIYISREYEVAAHLCLCGCGAKLITPLGPAEWTLTEHDDTVSLSPSVGNDPKSCRSHYEIANSTVQWLPPVSADAHQRAVQRDARELEAHLRRQNRWWRRLRRLLRQIWNRLWAAHRGN